jgi:hypothetical protein
MATVNFRIKGVNKTAGIKVRFKQGDLFDYELSTGLKVNRKHWSSKQQRVKNLIDAPYKDSLNKKLNGLETFIMNSYYDACTSSTKITQVWLREKVSKYLNEPLNKNDESSVYFIPFIENFIKQAKKIRNKNTGKPLTESTIKTYHTTLKKLKAYETRHGIKLKITDINLKFHLDFIHFL